MYKQKRQCINKMSTRTYEIVLKFGMEFKQSKDNTEFDYQSDRPKNRLSDKQVNANHPMVFDEGHLTVQQIDKSIGISFSPF